MQIPTPTRTIVFVQEVVLIFCRRFSAPESTSGNYSQDNELIIPRKM